MFLPKRAHKDHRKSRGGSREQSREQSREAAGRTAPGGPSPPAQGGLPETASLRQDGERCLPPFSVLRCRDSRERGRREAADGQVCRAGPSAGRGRAAGPARPKATLPPRTAALPRRSPRPPTCSPRSPAHLRGASLRAVRAMLRRRRRRAPAARPKGSEVPPGNCLAPRKRPAAPRPLPSPGGSGGAGGPCPQVSSRAPLGREPAVCPCPAGRPVASGRRLPGPLAPRLALQAPPPRVPSLYPAPLPTPPLLARGIFAAEAGQQLTLPPHLGPQMARTACSAAPVPPRLPSQQMGEPQGQTGPRGTQVNTDQPSTLARGEGGLSLSLAV